MSLQQVATGYGLVEGPVWDPAKGLYFSDVVNGGVYLLDRSDKVSTVIPKRRGVGGIALHEKAGLVVGGRDIAYVRIGDLKTEALLTAKEASRATGFNDLTTDAKGRIYVGSLAFSIFKHEPMKPGFLWMIDVDGSVRQVADGILVTNGLAVSADGKRLYHADARREMIRVYDVAEDGMLGHWRCFAHTGAGSVPDGLKVAADGSVFVADARGSRVAVFGPDGRHLRDIKVPLPMVTSVCFGGDDLRDLYVVTGSRDGPRENCGTVFRVRSEVAGIPVPAARVRVSD